MHRSYVDGRFLVTTSAEAVTGSDPAGSELISHMPNSSREEDIEQAKPSAVAIHDLKRSLRASNERAFGASYVDRESLEAMQGFLAGIRCSDMGGANSKQSLDEFAQTHVV